MQIAGSLQAEIETRRGISLRSFLLLISGLRRYCRVEGYSMMPTIHPGDLVIYRPIKSNESYPCEGNIVVAKDPVRRNSLIIKRIYKKNSEGLDLRGDNNHASTDSRQFGIVQNHNLCGIVEQIITSKSTR